MMQLKTVRLDAMSTTYSPAGIDKQSLCGEKNNDHFVLDVANTFGYFEHWGFFTEWVNGEGWGLIWPPHIQNLNTVVTPAALV